MAEDIKPERFERARWIIAKLQTNWVQVDEMMVMHIKDGLGAMQYGQYGGSFPDPTAKTVINGNPDPEAPQWARDNRAETDRKEQMADWKQVEQILDRMDARRQQYMSANRDMWLRLDETEFCRSHWFYMHRDPDLQKRIPRRGDNCGDLCKECNEYRRSTGRAPDALEIEYYAKNLTWPPTRVDPKARKAV